MERKTRQKAVFLDRDGTICEDFNYLSRPKDLRIFPFAAKAIQLLNEAGFLVIIITNQSGIGRGYFTEETLNEINESMMKQLTSKNARIDALYFCPHLPENACKCRKPGTEMIENAAKEFGIDLEGSWMIGDKSVDIETGQNIGVKSAIVMTGYGKTELENCVTKPDLVSENLLSAALAILRTLK